MRPSASPFSPEEAAVRDKILEVHRRLVELYGERTRNKRRDPVSVLVSTILSQNTNDTLRDRAYKRLRERFPSWEEVRDAPLEAIEEAILPAGLSKQKALRIQEALRRITQERGSLDLSFLKNLNVEEARKWLMSLNGVGPKTAAIILLFSLNMPAFPVDTHIFRVSKRLGLIPRKATREKAHQILERLIPPEFYYTFHLNVIEYGRKVCTSRNPKCEVCRLRDLCEFYQQEDRG
ncbi:MAG: endonuclease III [Chloroflexi bacterium]|nr:MAG: endonuclease III [Chloroflexota bacterium]HDN79771.1 endonuclease III [Chloroflexota bacterium]